MEDNKRPKSFEMERLVFFSDAVVAIVITLLALDLKVVANKHLSFADIGHAWQKFAAFLLSYVYIAVFWTIHHKFFRHISQIDNRVLWYNLIWLLFIVLLPFSTSLISDYFSDTPAMVTYCTNTLMLTLLQNQIWDYVAAKPEYLNENTNKEIIYDFQLTCNVAMINALLALVIAFFNPVIAAIILITRLLMIAVAKKIFKPKK